MNEKPSKALGSEYHEISELARKTGEPVYITDNGQRDMVLMDIDKYERMRQEKADFEQCLAVLQSEFRRLNGAQTFTLEESRARIQEIFDNA